MKQEELPVNRRKFAQALRELNTQVVTCGAPDESFAEHIEAIENISKKLADKPRRRRIVATEVAKELVTEGEMFQYRDMLNYSPIGGLANPLAPPLRIQRKGDTTSGLVNFPKSCEGAPGCVHGGYVAAAFDEFLGVTQALSGKAGMTGTLVTIYRSPCPISADLSMKGTVESINGRKIITKALMHAGSKLVAEAEAIFILVN